MGVLTMVLGPSGSGKSTSLASFGMGEAEIFCVTGKRLPFRLPLEVHTSARYPQIYEALARNEKLCYVIDDSTYLMQLDNFARAGEKGFDKFTDMATSFERLLEWAMATSPDTTVYFMHHPQFSEAGAGRPQTVGKMLDNQLCIEGLFDLVLECAVADGKHVFYTNEHGLAKSPINMLKPVMPNDLFAVDQAIRAYWNMAPIRRERAEAC